MLYCRRCQTFQHAVCYGIYTSADVLEVDHCCGWCAIKYNVTCTSHEIYLFCVRKGKTEEDRRVFVLRLTARRIVISFFLFEFRGYQNANPPLATYLMVRFELSKTYAERVLFHLLRLNVIEYQPEFRVKIENAQTIFETGKMPVIVYTNEPTPPSASNSGTDNPRAEALDESRVPSRPTPSFASQDPIRMEGDSPSSSIKISQETFESLKSGHFPLEAQTHLKAVASQACANRSVGLEPIMTPPVPNLPLLEVVAALSPQKEKTPRRPVGLEPDVAALSPQKEKTPRRPVGLKPVVAALSPQKEKTPRRPVRLEPDVTPAPRLRSEPPATVETSNERPPGRPTAMLNPEEEKPRNVRQLSPMATALLSSDDDVGPDPDPQPPVRSPRLDSAGKRYRLVFDWPVGWAKRESRRDDESVYPLDVNEISEGYVSPLVGQIDEVGKQTEFSRNAFPPENYNAEFSVKLNGVIVHSYIFGTEEFCKATRTFFAERRGTYMIFERYGKVKRRVGSQLAINHLWKLDVTKRTILTPVTAKRDYSLNDLASRPNPVTPSNPDKQAFNRRFGQGHLTPAALRESARKKKQKEPNAKQKLLMLDGQTRMFDYVSPASDSATRVLDFTPNRRKILTPKTATSGSCATVVKIPGITTTAPSCRHSKVNAPPSLKPPAAGCSTDTVGSTVVIVSSKPSASKLGLSPLPAVVPQSVGTASSIASPIPASFPSTEDPQQFSFDPDPNATFEPVFGNSSDDSDHDTQEGRYNTPDRGD